MTKRRAAVGALLVAGLAAGLALLLRRDASEPPAASPVRPEPMTAPLIAHQVAPPAEVSPSDAGTTDAFVTVVSAAGKPLSGAEVYLQRVSTRMAHMRMTDVEVLTDANGVAKFPALPAQDYDLGVLLDYFHPYEGELVSGATITLEPIPPVHGRVLSPTRVPVVGALVSSMGRTASTTHSGPDGRFTLPMPSLELVVAEKNGVVGFSASLAGEDVDLSKELEIILDDGTPLIGHTLQRSGEPLAGVSLEIALGAIHLHQTTGADGVFRVPTREGAFMRGEFSKPGYVTIERTWMYELGEEKDVVLSRPTTIDGQLVDLEGRPVANATVLIVEPWDPGRDRPETQTDREGRFVLRDLHWEWVELRALSAGQDAEQRVDLPEGKTVPVKLVLRPELFPVKLEVVTAAGQPVTMYEVEATPVPAAGWTGHARMFGTLDLNRGRFRLQVTSDDGRTADVTLDVDPKPDMQPLRIVVRGDGGVQFEDELPPTPVKIRVVTAAGLPVSGAQVDCYSTRGVTGDDGRVECQVQANDHAWPLHIIATKGTESGVARATGKESEVQVVIKSAHPLRGRVVGQLPAADVWLEINNANGGDEVELKGNSFSLEGRAAIRTFVCVVHAPKDVEPRKLGCAVSEGDEELVIPVGAPGTLAFTAVDDSTAPLEAPIVYVDRVRQTVEAPKGVVKLEVAPGDHVLVLNKASSRIRVEARFTVQAGQTTALGVLRLQ